MRPTKTAISDALKAEAPASDGRRARSQASRSKIVEALMELIVSGHSNPSTANIAKQAGVGLRSVFRHFDDKDAIYREVDAILVRAYQPVIEAPFQSEDWQSRLMEMVERRCQISEELAPYRISSAAARERSAFLKENYQQLHNREKSRLNAVLPSHMQTGTPVGRAILVAMSFDTWRLLRLDEHLSADETVIAVKRLVSDIIDRAEV